MTGAETKEAPKNIGKLLHLQSSTPKAYAKRSRRLKSHGNTMSSPMSNKKFVDLLTKRRKASYKASKSLASCQNQKKQLATTGLNQDAECEKGNPISEKSKRGRKRKGINNKVEVDEASRIQRRTRYLLIKMKIEQNLLDAYSTEGWKGQSREKIKPERELQRAKNQILKCKLGIRDALRQLDLLSSDGCIDESVIAPDGSIHHDNIHCAKCKLRDAFPDNDIILCDGTCNCAFHQMCIDPPLLTENIPPGDQGWFCKYCICKTEIMEAMNAHLGTNYPHHSNWQDIFKVEATLPDGGETILNQEEWPSDDSGDDDYDPERVEKHESDLSRVWSEGESCGDDDVSSSYSLVSLDDEPLDDESQKLINDMGFENSSADFIGSGSGSDCEFKSGRRQRQAVDYRKLYDEMFGKDAFANEQVSEDEDWGPTNKKRREKESDAASTLMTLWETEDKSAKDAADIPNVETNISCKESKRSFFRIPPEAVEKLRLVFAKNELPSRAVKEDISKELGLDLDKVNKWFKNARYLSLKTRKAGEEKPAQADGVLNSKETESKPANNEASDEIVSANMPTTSAHTLNKRKNAESLTSTSKQQLDERELHLSTSTNKVVDNIDLGDGGESLLRINENEKVEEINEEAESHMEKLCFLKTKLEKLQQLILVRTPNRKGKSTAASSDNSNTIFVPIAHLKEKH